MGPPCVQLGIPGDPWITKIVLQGTKMVPKWCRAPQASQMAALDAQSHSVQHSAKGNLKIGERSVLFFDELWDEIHNQSKNKNEGFGIKMAPRIAWESENWRAFRSCRSCQSDRGPAAVGEALRSAALCNFIAQLRRRVGYSRSKALGTLFRFLYTFVSTTLF